MCVECKERVGEGYLVIPYSLAPGMSGYRGRSPMARTKWFAVFLISCPFLLTAYNATNGHIFKGRVPGINSSQSKNVGKIQVSMQLSHLSINKRTHIETKTEPNTCKESTITRNSCLAQMKKVFN